MGFKQSNNVPSMERELNYFLYDLCVNWGFCIPPKEGERISKEISYNAHEFANDLLEAEGMNPSLETKWIYKIVEKFIKRFGTEEICIEGFEGRCLDVDEVW